MVSLVSTLRHVRRGMKFAMSGPIDRQNSPETSALRGRVFVIHSIPLMRAGLAELIRRASALLKSEVANFANIDEAQEGFATLRTGDVVVIDTPAWSALDAPSGQSQLRQFKARGVAVGLVAAAGRDAAKLLSKRGICGLLPPDADFDAVAAFVEDLASGRSHFTQSELSPEATMRLSRLSSRQFEILELMTRGLLNKQIAFELGLTEGTVKSHVSAILEKLGCDRRTQAVTAFMQCFGLAQERAAFVQ
jgi:DNA-binding NarL/FixJ family response regulator